MTVSQLVLCQHERCKGKYIISLDYDSIQSIRFQSDQCPNCGNLNLHLWARRCPGEVFSVKLDPDGYKDCQTVADVIYLTLRVVSYLFNRGDLVKKFSIKPEERMLIDVLMDTWVEKMSDFLTIFPRGVGRMNQLNYWCATCKSRHKLDRDYVARTRFLLCSYCQQPLVPIGVSTKPVAPPDFSVFEDGKSKTQPEEDGLMNKRQYVCPSCHATFDVVINPEKPQTLFPKCRDCLEPLIPIEDVDEEPIVPVSTLPDDMISDEEFDIFKRVTLKLIDNKKYFHEVFPPPPESK